MHLLTDMGGYRASSTLTAAETPSPGPTSSWRAPPFLLGFPPPPVCHASRPAHSPTHQINYTHSRTHAQQHRPSTARPMPGSATPPPRTHLSPRRQTPRAPWAGPSAGSGCSRVSSGCSPTNQAPSAWAARRGRGWSSAGAAPEPAGRFSRSTILPRWRVAAAGMLPRPRSLAPPRLPPLFLPCVSMNRSTEAAPASPSLAPLRSCPPVSRRAAFPCSSPSVDPRPYPASSLTRPTRTRAPHPQVRGFLDSPLWVEMEPLEPGIMPLQEQTQQARWRGCFLLLRALLCCSAACCEGGSRKLASSAVLLRLLALPPPAAGAEKDQ